MPDPKRVLILGGGFAGVYTARLLERMLFRTDEATLALAEVGRPWAFDAPGAAFKLATEAYRITLAHLFDPMMAIHTSKGA